LELIKFDVSNTSYYVELEKWCTVARRRAVMESDAWRSWKVIEVVKICMEKCWNRDEPTVLWNATIK